MGKTVGIAWTLEPVVMKRMGISEVPPEKIPSCMRMEKELESEIEEKMRARTSGWSRQRRPSRRSRAS